MSQINEPRERVITFRVTGEQFSMMEECGSRSGYSVNEWCRNLAVSESSCDFGMSANERVLVEEIAVLRTMLGVILKRELKPEQLEEVRKNADELDEEY